MITSAAQRYLPQVRELLDNHKLKVPLSTADMLAETVRKCHSPPKQRMRRTRERFRTALTHARALLRYAQKPPTRSESVKKRFDKLRDALNGFDAIVWLSVPIPQIRSVLHRIQAGRTPNTDELTRLIQALSKTTSAAGARSGRPMEQLTAVVRAGCITWFRAGRKLSRTWDDVSEFVGGPLADFIRDLLTLCDLKMKEGALYSAIQAAVPYIENNPNLRPASAKTPDFPS